MNAACKNGPLETRGILANSITGGNKPSHPARFH